MSTPIVGTHLFTSMAQPSVYRTMVFAPATRLTDFIGIGYRSNGVAQSSLSSLLPIYPSVSLVDLAALSRNQSLRAERAAERAGDPVDLDESPCFQVFFFKKFNQNLPAGYTVEAFATFFTNLFSFISDERKTTHYDLVVKLLTSPHYYILAISVSLVDPDTKQLHHYIIAAAMYMYDNTNGSFIHSIGVTETGYFDKCQLTEQFFIDPSEKTILSDTASFRGKSLCTFMLSLIQVLGFLGYTSPLIDVDRLSEPFVLVCNEVVDAESKKTHHLYLQARIEVGSAYVMYVMMGFTTLATPGSSYHCESYQRDCPVHRTKKKFKFEVGYHTDDNCLRLLVQKRWIFNVWPADLLPTYDVPAANLIWSTIPGISENYYRTNALIPPFESDLTTRFTNNAYWQLLICHNVMQANRPLVVEELPVGMEALPIPIEWTVPIEGRQPNMHLLASSNGDIGPSDLRRYLYRNMKVHIGDTHLDALDAIAAPLYTEGNIVHSGEEEYSHAEMTLELRLNLQAFYQRCAHYVFLVPSFDKWSQQVVNEFQYISVHNLLTEYGLADFNGDLVPIFEFRFEWKQNFIILAKRLTSLGTGGALRPAMWLDIFALQLLYSELENPVVFAPVQTFTETLPTAINIHPHLGLPEELRSFPPGKAATTQLFTVVPIMALNATRFGYFEFEKVMAITIPSKLCDAINNWVSFPIEPEEWTEFLHFKPLLVSGGAFDYTPPPLRPNHCASEVLCLSKPPEPAARMDVHRCPGCGKPVHFRCGFANSQADPQDFITCFRCFNKHFRTLTGKEDPLYRPVSPRRTPRAHPTSPAKNTRHLKPHRFTESKTTRQNRRLFDEAPTNQTKRERVSVERFTAAEEVIDSKNPKYMYPKGAATNFPADFPGNWWFQAGDDDSNDSYPDDEVLPEIEVGSAFAVTKPTETHMYSQDELTAFSQSVKRNEPRSSGPQSFSAIVTAAKALARYLRSCADYDETKNPPWLHRLKPQGPNNNDPIYTNYTEQELIHICCLLDRERPLQVDTWFDGKMEFISLQIQSYHLPIGHQLRLYTGQDKLDAIPQTLMTYSVRRVWLKSYLDWFDPALFEFICAGVDGTSVQRLQHRMAAEDNDSYEQQGIMVKDQLFVPLPKMHRVVSTKDKFGTTVNGKYVPYCKNAFPGNLNLSQGVLHPKYNVELTATCNPVGFDHVPVARMPTPSVPDIHRQIKALRAQIRYEGTTKEVVRWLGLQGGRYVSLPTPWVILNFDPTIVMEAMALARKTEPEAYRQFLTIPPGDCRNDDPPISIRHGKGSNYYFQGEVDNCAIGGLSNAVFCMLGKACADRLLQFVKPDAKSFWNMFVKHIQGSLPGYRVPRRNCHDILTLDDSSPFVAQLRAKDNSESHAICIFQGCIFDSASRFVLKKNQDALEWCCGVYGFDRHLRIYQLEKILLKKPPPAIVKKKQRFRYK